MHWYHGRTGPSANTMQPRPRRSQDVIVGRRRTGKTRRIPRGEGCLRNPRLFPTGSLLYFRRFQNKKHKTTHTYSQDRHEYLLHDTKSTPAVTLPDTRNIQRQSTLDTVVCGAGCPVNLANFLSTLARSCSVVGPEGPCVSSGSSTPPPVSSSCCFGFSSTSSCSA